MPYNTDKRRLDQLLPYLAPLAQGIDAQWEVKHGSPNTVAYRIREALHIARMYPDEYPDLAKYAPDYAIAVKSQTLVTARRKTPVMVPLPTMAPPLEPRAVASLQEVDVASLRRQPVAFSAAHGAALHSVGTFPTDGPQSPDSIIDIWSKGGSVKRTLYFPDAQLTPRQLAELWLWAEKNSVMLMVADQAVTLAVYDARVAEHSWKPDPIWMEQEFGDDL